MPDQSDRLGLPYILPSQAQKHVTHNEALRLLDALVQLTVEGFDAQIPPAVPVAGTCHALAADPVGDWAGQGGRLALREADGWRFIAPRQGWLAWDRPGAELRVFGAAGWAPVPIGAEQTGRLGIATAPDDTNRLAVASDATLLTHDGAGHRLKINKAAAADTASLLFQSGWTGHAEMGLAGGLAFSVKVSPDGATWSEAMRADPLAQQISWAPAAAVRMTLDDAALQLDVPVTGAAVQATATDTTPGRLMRADYGYGPGNLVGAVAQSDGNPEGAVIERGSNANGDYVRFADGTQICTVSGLSTSTSAGTVWTYPAAFTYPANPNRLSVGGAVAATFGSPAVMFCNGIANGTSVTVETLTLAGARVSKTVNLIAIGRWF